MKQLTIALIGMLIAMTSCGNKQEEQIEHEMASGVVLVQNQSYIEVVLPDGESVYFSGYDDEEGLTGYTDDKDSIEVNTAYGTGFFISRSGEIATNNHIVENNTSDQDILKAITSELSIAKIERYANYREAKELYEALLTQKNDMEFSYLFGDISDYEYERYIHTLGECKELMDQYELEYTALNLTNVNECEVIRHNEISIAYNNTHVTSTTDFVPCVITKTDDEHDLAIIQLKDRQTPDNKFVFEVPNEDPLKTYTWQEQITKKVSEDKNSKQYMMSFNMGPILGVTPDCLKAQFNDGHVSQKTSDRIMYSIPALPGSSGSPVVNRQGQLVAINYAGLNGTQNFNYGIRVKHLNNLINQ